MKKMTKFEVDRELFLSELETEIQPEKSRQRSVQMLDQCLDWAERQGWPVDVDLWPDAERARLFKALYRQAHGAPWGLVPANSI